MPDTIPPWLQAMRDITGTHEAPGDKDNKTILGWRDKIAATYEDMRNYCNTYQHDATPWCGLTAGYCMTMAGIRPPYKQGSDTDSFYWAQAWASDPGYQKLDTPRPGCVVVMTRSGGGHVTFYERTEGSKYVCRGGNQSDQVNEASFPISSVIGLFWPKGTPLPPAPPAERRTLEQGDEGPDVASLQTTLGVHPADGDFGPITDSAVKGYQAACSIVVDGEVGPQTWGKLDELDRKVAGGSDGLPPELIAAIIDTAKHSALARVQWKDRGTAPIGYIVGMALSFALALERLNAEDDAAWAMAKENTGNADKDVFAWYDEEFDDAGMDNSEAGVDCLRHLFALMIGLGMRESSGRYCEGRDQSASNATADTAEAGMFQTSWNIRSCSSTIPPLLPEYWRNPCGFREQFQEGVSLKSSDLGNFGSGDGAQFQFLSKYAPAFHALVTAVGLRNLRQHWGPINRHEAELRSEADAMLHAVQALVEGASEPKIS